jgi:hypothetical protein
VEERAREKRVPAESVPVVPPPLTLLPVEEVNQWNFA